MNISILGTGMTQFGELWESSPRMLARQAVEEALSDAEVTRKEIEAVFVANMLSGMLGMQGHLGALFSEELQLFVPAYTVEGACASGGLSIHTAVNSILSGQYETVLVLGVEKMTDHKPEQVSSALMGAGSNEERLAGATFPGLYAMLARAHMEKYQTKERELASVAVKNHYHASLNPKAQYRKPITIEQVLASSYVADPLKLLDCSPVTDGAAAVILSKKHKSKGVSIVASQVAVDTLGLAQRKALTTLVATTNAAKSAYHQAEISTTDIDVLEVHDCFTIAEILALEDLGITNKGEAASQISRGYFTLGSAKHCVVNTSGGLKGCGHPVGATGVKQVVEIADQLRDRCGKRQIENASVGLTHNVGGTGATAVVHIIKRETYA